jgi:hypothetical protein
MLNLIVALPFLFPDLDSAKGKEEIAGAVERKMLFKKLSLHVVDPDDPAIIKAARSMMEKYPDILFADLDKAKAKEEIARTVLTVRRLQQASSLLANPDDPTIRSLKRSLAKQIQILMEECPHTPLGRFLRVGIAH